MVPDNRNWITLGSARQVDVGADLAQKEEGLNITQERGGFTAEGFCSRKIQETEWESVFYLRPNDIFNEENFPYIVRRLKVRNNESGYGYEKVKKLSADKVSAFMGYQGGSRWIEECAI